MIITEEAVKRHLKGTNTKKLRRLEPSSAQTLCGGALRTPRTGLPPVPTVQGVAVTVEGGKSDACSQQEAEVGAEQLLTYLTPLGDQQDV